MLAKKLRLAHHAVMLEDAQQSLALGRELVRQHQGQALDTYLEPPTEDAMIHIGDNHTHMPQPSAPKSVVSKLLPAILAGTGILAGGLGALGLSALLSRPAAPSAEWPAKEFDIHWKFDGKDFKVDAIKPVQ